MPRKSLKDRYHVPLPVLQGKDTVVDLEEPDVVEGGRTAREPAGRSSPSRTRRPARAPRSRTSGARRTTQAGRRSAPEGDRTLARAEVRPSGRRRAVSTTPKSRTDSAGPRSKTGVRSTAKKRRRARAGFQPMPAASPTAGAFGRTGSVAPEEEEIVRTGSRPENE